MCHEYLQIQASSHHFAVGGGGVKSDPFRSDSTETPLIQGANLLNLGVTFPNLLKPSSIMATPLAGDATDMSSRLLFSKKAFKEN